MLFQSDRPAYRKYIPDLPRSRDRRVRSPDDVTAGLQRFADLGVTHASLRFGWPGTPREVVEGAIRLAAREVLPALRRRRSATIHGFPPARD